MDIKIPRADTMRFNHSATLIQRDPNKFNKVDFNRMEHSNLRKSAICKKVLSLILV